jgi:classical protein kinase C
MNNDDDALNSVYKKIERERALLNAASQMRQQTQNEAVRSRIDTQMREGRRNIQYLEERMQELQMRRMGQGLDNLTLGSGNGTPPMAAAARNDRDGPPTPPPKDSRGGFPDAGGDRGGYGTLDYSTVGGHGDMMPPRHPYAPPGPSSAMPKTRPNYTKLGQYTRRSVVPSLLTPLRRSHQVRHAAPGTPNPAHAVTTRIQAQC